MIDITKFLEIIKKQGATGVLALWLWYTHSDVQDLKSRLYDCYGQERQSSVTNEISDNTCFAILPKDEITKAIKKRRA
jgi:hypothetical protein